MSVRSLWVDAPASPSGADNSLTQPPEVCGPWLACRGAAGCNRHWMESRGMRDVVVVGGGLAGLSAGWRLRHWDVIVL